MKQRADEKLELSGAWTAMCSALLVGIYLVLPCHLPCRAEIKADLIDVYLQGEFDWAMRMDIQDVSHYMNYPGSRLHSLTKVDVTFMSFLRSQGIQYNKAETRRYEELWYHQGTPVGLRRRSQLMNLDTDNVGAVVVGPDNVAGEHSSVLANALVGLLIDLQFKHMVTDVVLVPKDRFDNIADALRRYRFANDKKELKGKQMSIHLRSYPSGRDECYYYSPGYGP